MVFIKFESLLLALLLVSFALKHHSAQADHQGMRMKTSLVKEAEENNASVNKELVDGTSATEAGSKEEKIGGRKMMGAMLKKKEDIQGTRKDEGESATSTRSTASGATHNANKLNEEAEKDKNASKESLEGPQELSSNLKEGLVSTGDHEDEWRRILEEADKKVMQLMTKDYSGMRRPRRKPPINNYEPNN